MNSQKKKDTLYPENFTEEDKLNYDIYFEQSKQLFPNLAGDEWVLRMGILAFMEKEKRGITEPPTEEEINEIKERYNKDAVYYTIPEDCPVINENANLIIVQE